MPRSIPCWFASSLFLVNGFFTALAQDAAPADDLAERFSVPEGFRIECVADNELTKSLWAMTFDHQGRIVVSRQQGPIFTLIDQDNDGVCDIANQFDARLTSSQGLAFVDGSLYSVGEVDDKVGLYRLTDENGDDQADRLETLGHFRSGGMGEHAPHAVIFGPDGFLYVAIGNHTKLPESIDPDSPLNWAYEGQLLPRYDDARGHAAGILAPGGKVAQIDLATNHWRRFAGGFRNAYDIAFNQFGELFTYDSDMEWDERMPWYRPTRVNHVIPAGDYGWRHGSGKWPEYFFDSLPTTLDLGRGSPCGVVIYKHKHFPPKYQGAFFLSDWSRGRIVVVYLKQAGATYSCESETFATGRPLNVNDIEVGPDGALYFSIGGRGTEGGVYRIVYDHNDLVETVPLGASVTIDDAIDQPQPDSAWARARLREIKTQLDDRWSSGLLAIAKDTNRAAEQRAEALFLLQQFGPAADEPTLNSLSQDTHADVRASAVYLLGLHSSDATLGSLVERLNDPHSLVRRRACEALVRAGFRPPAVELLPLLGDSERWVRYAARALVRRSDPAEYQTAVLQSNDPRIAIEGMLALLANVPSQAQIDDLVEKQLSILQTLSSEDALNDELLLDWLRLVQLTLIAGAPPNALDPVEPVLLQAFNRDDWRVKREVARLLAFLDEPRAIPLMLDQLESDISREQQIHYAYCLRTMKTGWTPESLRRFVAWFGRTREWSGGASFSGYLDLFWNDALKLLPAQDRDDVLAKLESSTKQSSAAPAVPSQNYNYPPQELEDFLLRNPAGKQGDVDRGHASFVKAGCAVCHKFGDQLPGRGLGPDLTTVAARFKRHEILDAILHPSQVISDQYKAINVLTADGKVVTGIRTSSADDAEQLILKRTDGSTLTLSKDDVVRTGKAMSMMAEGTLNALTLEEIADLFAYLESGGNESP